MKVYALALPGLLVLATVCGLPCVSALAAEDGGLYWCPMRGRPCDMTDFQAAGTCPDCGMALITKAAYDELEAAGAATSKTIGVVLYRGFELLDVSGPVEMWANVPDFRIVFVAEKAGPVTSMQFARITADYAFEDCPKLDILMVPGGMGTLKELQNERLIAFLKQRSSEVAITTSVCSGSALLAKAGVLDGHKATSNKKYFSVATAQSKNVEWIRQARWVDDGAVITSSGVSAGIDMALHLIRRLYDEESAAQIAQATEYIWNQDADNDPFASPGN